MILPATMLLDKGTGVPPFDKPGWLYEIKFDGYRIVAGVENGNVRLMTRSGADATKWFPEVVQGLGALEGGPHILDGEVCVLDDLGRSDFNRLQDRARRRRWYEGADAVVFCVFDLLHRDARNLIDLPVEARKSELRVLLTPAPASTMFVGHFDSDEGRTLFGQAKELKLEGLVAKRLGSPYKPGIRSPDWVKVKVPGAIPPERFKR